MLSTSLEVKSKHQSHSLHHQIFPKLTLPLKITYVPKLSFKIAYIINIFCVISIMKKNDAQTAEVNG